MTKFDTSRLGRLLNMEYTPRELSEELACSIRQIRNALLHGCPHRQTENGHYYINGRAFCEWVESQKPPAKQRLKDNEAYCFRCRSAVPFVAVEVTQTNGNSELAKGICPNCGGKINRARRREQ
jgi:hypothetical protein